MTGYFTFNGHRFKAYLFYVFCVLLILFAADCGDEKSGGQTSDQATSASSATGSASFSIQWHPASLDRNATGALVRQAIENCTDAGVASITCEVYDESNNPIASGGPWPCDTPTHSGTIERIPAGSNRTFTVLGWNSAGGDGDVIYQGQTAGITINPGVIADAGTIDTYEFVPNLIAPNDGDQQVDPTNVSLEWELLENAYEYLVQVAEDDQFQTIIINETTPATVYAPSTLKPITEYFWKISAIDAHNNVGAESIVRSFITSNAPVISGTISTAAGAGISGVTITFSNNGGTATTNSSGSYSRTVPYGWNGSAAPSLSGYTFSPASRPYTNVTTDQADQNYIGTYTQQTGSLQVTILPAAAVTAGAQWRVDGGTWRNSGYTQTGLSVGSHTVSFSTLSGWNTPGNQTVNITSNNTTTASGTYIQIAPPVISGYVRLASGFGIGGVTITFSNGGGTATTSTGGSYIKTVPYGWSGTATPSIRGYSFNPPYISYSNVTANLSGQNYTAVEPGPPVISGIYHNYIGYVDYCINSQGQTFSGYNYNVYFNYDDPDGDADDSDGGYVTVNNVVWSWATIGGNGFNGTVTVSYCNPSPGVLLHITMTDGAGRTSNQLDHRLTED